MASDVLLLVDIVSKRNYSHEAVANIVGVFFFRRPVSQVGAALLLMALHCIPPVFTSLLVSLLVSQDPTSVLLLLLHFSAYLFHLPSLRRPIGVMLLLYVTLAPVYLPSS